MVFIHLMNTIDEYHLDGRLLSMFVAVHETGSVTAAALALNVTQSTVSHGLNRLRDITGDALFVPRGRGITPTEKADALIGDARQILIGMKRFTQSDTYDPASDVRAFTVAATDYEIERFVKPFIKVLRSKAPNVQIRAMRFHSDDEWARSLREGHFDVVLAPEMKAAESDLMQRRISVDDHDVCYYDPAMRDAPKDIDAYCAASHVIMNSGPFRKTETDRILRDSGRERHIVASLPGFGGVATILRGSDLVALMPASLQDSIFSGLGHCEPAFTTPKYTISCIWHTRVHASPRHKWMRSQFPLTNGKPVSQKPTL